jgi:hypothetical protein
MPSVGAHAASRPLAAAVPARPSPLQARRSLLLQALKPGNPYTPRHRRLLLRGVKHG